MNVVSKSFEGYGDVFDSYGNVCLRKLFKEVYGTLASKYTFEYSSVDIESTAEAVYRKYKDNIVNINKVSTPLSSWCYEFTFDKNLIVVVDTNGYSAFYDEHSEHFVEPLSKLSVLKERNNTMGVVIRDGGGTKVHTTVLGKREIDLQANYNQLLIEEHDSIAKCLSSDKTGIMLFYGDPGTGKSTYIRHLINCVDKRFIFVPVEVAEELTNPSFLHVLIENKNSVLVIEDAEKLITSRESGRTSAIAGLLNLTDGLLAQVVKLQVICTFNTSLDRIDSALTRKGRLLHSHEFKQLSEDKTKALLEKLGCSSPSPTMSLADIYNTDQKEFMSKKKPLIGFVK